MEIFAFYAGLAFVFTKSFYALLFLFVLLTISLRLQLVIYFVLALGWAQFHHFLYLDKNMPKLDVIPKSQVEGLIHSIPNSNETRTQFYFLINRLDNQPVKAMLLLACYQKCPLFKVGQHWQFDVKLKRPHNFANPGGFDYKNMLASHHIYWTGYIKSGSYKLIKAQEKKSILSLRQNLAVNLEKLIVDKKVLGIIEALTLGVTTNLSKNEWDLFRRTGTTHLLVISGAHIGLIAGFSYWIINYVWSLGPRLCLYRPAPQIASIAGFIMALIYSLLAGFGAPAKRALISTFFVSLSMFSQQKFTAWQAWRSAIFIILFFEPHCVLLPGFYLSFLAVAILMLTARLSVESSIKKNLSLQFACLIGLLPLSLYWFSYGAINGIFANLIAIPLVSFVLVPLALLSLLLSLLFPNPTIFVPLKIVVFLLFKSLHWVDSFSTINLNFSLVNILSAIVIMTAFFSLFFLPIKSWRFPTFVLIFLGFFPSNPSVKEGEVKLYILDVGQGLSVFIKTRNHHLIYDTGAKFFHGGDMAKLVIIPFFQKLGVRHLDKIIISHPDLDHRGGLVSLEKLYPADELIVDKVAFYHRGKSCYDYPAWQWDGIDFRFLPMAKEFRDKNNGSCVLQIKNRQLSVLLAGDIEKRGERYLVKHFRESLASNYLLIPHHGSKTSSSMDFIKAVSPLYAIISSGYDNRYHFPHSETLKTLSEMKINLYNTASCGMISLHLTKNKLMKPTCYQD